MTADRELDRLRQAMAAETPAPDARRKADAMARAQRAFTAHHGARPAPSESAWRGRLRHARGVVHRVSGRAVGAALAATAAVVVGVAVLQPQLLTPPSRPAPAAMSDAMQIARPDTAAPRARGAELHSPMPDARSADAHSAEATAAAPQARDGDGAGAPSSVPGAVTLAEAPIAMPADIAPAAYAQLRATLLQGHLPRPDTVRIGDIINAVQYDLPHGAQGPTAAAFTPAISVIETPWNPDTSLVLIARQAGAPGADRPPLNLVVLLDTESAMGLPNGQRQLADILRALAARLRPEDRIAVLTDGSTEGIVLPPTAANALRAVETALFDPGAGAPGPGAGGVAGAYRLADRMRGPGETATVVLATGTAPSLRLLDDFADAAGADSGVAGLVLHLGDAGAVAGAAADQLADALLSGHGAATMQVSFDPARVAAFRRVDAEAFDTARAGAAMQEGRAAMVLYEVTPVDFGAARTEPDLGTVRLRWTPPGASEAQTRDLPIPGATGAGPEARFAAAVAGFGLLLRGSPGPLIWGYDDAIALATATRGADPDGRRQQMIDLMRRAANLTPR